MRFGAIATAQAEGHILGHNVSAADGQMLYRKGKKLTAQDLTALQSLGYSSIYVAQLEAGDVCENPAAQQIANAVLGSGLRVSSAANGRVNLFARQAGVLRVNVACLHKINACEGISFATLPEQSVVQAGRLVATLKILPFALPGSTVRVILAIAHTAPVLAITPFTSKRVSLIFASSPQAQQRVQNSFLPALQARIAECGAVCAEQAFLALHDESSEQALAQLLQEQVARNNLVLLAGETAIMDRQDLVPRAILRAGGEVTCWGVPVDPGNFLLIGYLNGVPLIGAPGCVRSRKHNVLDMILPRLLVGDYLTQLDMAHLGHGGLLDEIFERPVPREHR
ncbi:MAG TPA: molybdopterin-binding protein [Anaerolineales bacterium]|nr:molybdopterin-binding protein [Anaerolineales bacterium]